VPVHLRAQAGDYAEACLLPGDPLRARWIAETLLEDARQVNGERGLLGFTGTYAGKPVSVQATGMGAPSTAIVFEELVELGVRRFLRVGTCGGLRPELALGDLVVALSAVPAESTSARFVGGEPHAPTADWELLHGAVHAAKGLGERPHVGPIATSDTFYDPDPERHRRWGARGILGVEMESSLLFTLAPLRGVQAATLLVVSDLVHTEDFQRIDDALLASAVERMTRIALATLTAEPKAK
jgi:DeoD family purine-nucleoside phosphorylase